ncbi:hypothetical protein ABZT16_15495 [Streptomyces flaveolus]|uniref:Uncharacterized protein n=2 Tax=Streptomyces TaxID=1883 RepID=A0ABV3A595_9ACTN
MYTSVSVRLPRQSRGSGQRPERAAGRTPVVSAGCLRLLRQSVSRSPALSPITGFMVSSIVVQYTDLLRTSDHDLWSRLRELLKGQGLDPDRTIVVDLLQEGPDHEDGQVISEDGRVYRFTLFYDQAAEHGARSAYLHGWTDVTDSWRIGSLATRTADAFAWLSSPTGSS